jgi:hypothetical protein
MHQLQALRALVGRITSNDPTTEKIKSILSRIEKEASGLADLIEKPDTMKSAVANELLTNAEKARLRTLAADSQGKLNNIIATHRAALDAARVQKAKLVPDGFASEIRSVFRSLDTAGKHALLGEAIKTGQAATVAAIVTAPTVLSGLTAQQSAQYREAFLDSVAPNNDAEAGEMQTVCDTALQIVESIARPSL